MSFAWLTQTSSRPPTPSDSSDPVDLHIPGALLSSTPRDSTYTNRSDLTQSVHTAVSEFPHSSDAESTHADEPSREEPAFPPAPSAQEMDRAAPHSYPGSSKRLPSVPPPGIPTAAPPRVGRSSEPAASKASRSARPSPLPLPPPAKHGHGSAPEDAPAFPDAENGHTPTSDAPAPHIPTILVRSPTAGGSFVREYSSSTVESAPSARRDSQPASFLPHGARMPSPWGARPPPVAPMRSGTVSSLDGMPEPESAVHHPATMPVPSLAHPDATDAPPSFPVPEHAGHAASPQAMPVPSHADTRTADASPSFPQPAPAPHATPTRRDSRPASSLPSPAARVASASQNARIPSASPAYDSIPPERTESAIPGAAAPDRAHPQSRPTGTWNPWAPPVLPAHDAPPPQREHEHAERESSPAATPYRGQPQARPAAQRKPWVLSVSTHDAPPPEHEHGHAEPTTLRPDTPDYAQTQTRPLTPRRPRIPSTPPAHDAPPPEHEHTEPTYAQIRPLTPRKPRVSSEAPPPTEHAESARPSAPAAAPRPSHAPNPSVHSLITETPPASPRADEPRTSGARVRPPAGGTIGAKPTSTAASPRPQGGALTTASGRVSSDGSPQQPTHRPTTASASTSTAAARPARPHDPERASQAPAPVRPSLPGAHGSGSAAQRSRYMNMLLAQDAVPRLHNLLASFFTWILLAGFVVLPGTFSSLQQVPAGSGVERTVLHAVQNIPLLVIGYICCAVGASGMCWLWWRWARNYIWLLDHIFVPGALNALAGLLSTVASIFGAQNGALGAVSIVTLAVTGSGTLVCGLLTAYYSLWKLERVKRRHEREVGREGVGERGEGGLHMQEAPKRHA